MPSKKKDDRSPGSTHRKREEPHGRRSTHSKDKRKSVTESELEEKSNGGWLALFYFTTKKHRPFAILGVIMSIMAGLLAPAEAYILGQLFESLAGFGAGTLTKDKMMADVQKWCIYLVVLGALGWFLVGSFFMIWLIFGELQCRSARDRLFNGLMKREMEWYDKRKNGIGALMIRVQMWVCRILTCF